MFHRSPKSPSDHITYTPTRTLGEEKGELSSSYTEVTGGSCGHVGKMVVSSPYSDFITGLSQLFLPDPEASAPVYGPQLVLIMTPS